MTVLTDIMDFEYHKAKRYVKKHIKNKSVVVEVYLTTVHYVHQHIDQKFEHPIDYLTTDVDLYDLYQGDQTRLIATCSALFNYWKLPPWSNADHTYSVFHKFPTLGSLCEYIEVRLR